MKIRLLESFLPKKQITIEDDDGHDLVVAARLGAYETSKRNKKCLNEVLSLKMIGVSEAKVESNGDTEEE